MNSKKNIFILGTGGTIAGTAPSSAQMTGYEAGKLNLTDLLDSVPHLDEVACFESEQLFKKGSQDLTDSDLVQLARKANAIVKRDDIDGLVITHGTATMEESAYFLNLVVKTHKPIVFVGAQRPASALSADGPLNLLEAAKLCIDPRARDKGVLIAMNNMFGGARDTMKTDTTNVSTFKNFETGIFGYMAGGSIWFINQSCAYHTYQSEFNIEEISYLPRVDIVLSHIGSDPTFYEAAINAKAKGIVISGLGNGAFNINELPGIQKAVNSGITVVRASRIPFGPVTRTKKAWDDLGLVFSGTLSPQKARILLQVALTKTRSSEEIQNIFLRY